MVQSGVSMRRRYAAPGRAFALGVVLLLACIAVAGCGGTQLQTPIVGTSILVNQDRVLLRQLEVPVLRVDNAHPERVYLSSAEVSTGQCRFYVSNDRGYTWTKGTAPSLAPYTDCGPGKSQPLNWRTTMAQAPDGTLYLAYAAHDPSAGGSRSALLARSTDSGNSWQTVAVDAAPSAASLGSPEVDFEPHVAIDSGNSRHVIVIFRRSYPRVNGKTLAPTRPYIADSTDGGATFSKPVLLFDRTIGFDPPYPALINGTLYISWHETFPAPSGGSRPPDKIWFSSSTDGGKTFTDHQITTGQNVDTPVLLYDSTRKKFNVFWDAGSNDLDIFYASSTDGSQWSSPKRLNDDNGHRDQELPAVAISPSGRIDVDWYDFRNDPYPIPASGDIGHRSDVYATSSFDGGATWGTNVRVNDLAIDRTKGVWNNEFFVQVPPAIASADQWAVTGWSDTRNGDADTSSQDIYAAPLAFDTSTIPAGQPGSGSSGYGAGDLALVASVVGVTGLLAGAGIALVVTRRRREARVRETV